MFPITYCCSKCLQSGFLFATYTPNGTTIKIQCNKCNTVLFDVVEKFKAGLEEIKSAEEFEFVCSISRESKK